MIITEGVGSCVEVNLFDREIRNDRIAVMADVNIILLADIEKGGEVGGICGGLQLLGKTILGPHHVESEIDQVQRLHFFDYTTVLTQHKTVK